MPWGAIASASMLGVEQAIRENGVFLKTLEGLPPDERQRRIERRQDWQTAERRHREAIRAQESASNRGGLSMAGLIFGAALIGSMCD